jgi:protoheme IX farnesyltransferase
VLFLVIFFWTPPHFWALAMRFRDDYAPPPVPMLPVVAAPAVVASRIVWYSWAMVATSLLLVLPGGPSGPVYGAGAAVLGAAFLREAHLLQSRVHRGEDAAPMRLFHWSITYLALLFLVLAVDALL